MEGVVYCLYAISQPLFEKTEIRNIYATGGFARNELWLQILSDIFNLPVIFVIPLKIPHGGQQKQAWRLWGLPFLQNPISKTYFPDTSVHSIYKKGFQKFQDLNELLKEEFV